MRSQFVRRTAAVVAGVALAVGGVGVAGALQANATPDSTRTVAALPTISIKADKTRVKVWTKVALTGKSTGVAAGTKVQVQRKQNGRWVNFPATTNVTKPGTYSVWVKSGRVGVNQFRVLTPKVASSPVNITITK
jgi:hypothetical protein